MAASIAAENLNKAINFLYLIIVPGFFMKINDKYDIQLWWLIDLLYNIFLVSVPLSIPEINECIVKYCYCSIPNTKCETISYFR